MECRGGIGGFGGCVNKGASEGAGRGRRAREEAEAGKELGNRMERAD